MMKTPLKNLMICSIMAFSCLNSTYAQKTVVNLKKNNQYSYKASTYQIGLEDLDMDGDLDAVCANPVHTPFVDNGVVYFISGNYFYAIK